MFKMNPEYKAKWIAALRSGDYQQHRKMANDSFNRDMNDCRPVGVDVTKRCCINVGAHAIVGDKADELGTVESVHEIFGYDCPSDIYVHLIKMNDIEQKSFNEIADWVEEIL